MEATPGFMKIISFYFKKLVLGRVVWSGSSTACLDLFKHVGQ